jgi:two-component system KDP operon response regulator KdpE
MKHSNRPTTLLIDNDGTARQILRNCLTRMDCRLLEACTAAQGLALVRSFRPTLVLTDIDMPGMDGVDLIRQIRAEKHSIVLAISGLAAPNFVIASLDAGADDFIPKPFSTGELRARVRVALRDEAMDLETDSVTPRDLVNAYGVGNQPQRGH